MARFYQTAQPYFVQDGIYNPPIEMMQGLLAKKEQDLDAVQAGYDSQLEALSKLQVLDSDRDFLRDYVDESNRFVEDSVARIMENPLDYRRHAKALRERGLKLAGDLQSGPLGAKVGNVELRNKLLASSAKLMNPDLVNRMDSRRLADLAERSKTDPYAKYDDSAIIGRPDISTKFLQYIAHIKANSTMAPDGKWIYQNEVVDENRIAMIAASMVREDVGYTGYGKQAHWLGDRGYMDGEGNHVPLLTVLDGSGSPISEEEYHLLPKEEKEKARITVNGDSAYAPDLLSRTTYASHTREGIQANPYELAKESLKNQKELAAYQHALDMLKLRAKPGTDPKSDFTGRGQEERDALLEKLSAECRKGNEPSCKLYEKYSALESHMQVFGEKRAVRDLMDELGVGSGVPLSDVLGGKHTDSTTFGQVEHVSARKLADALRPELDRYRGKPVDFGGIVSLDLAKLYEKTRDWKNGKTIRSELLKHKDAFLAKAKEAYGTDNSAVAVEYGMMNMTHVERKIRKVFESIEDGANRRLEDTHYTGSEFRNLYPIRGERENQELVRGFRDNSASYVVMDSKGNFLKEKEANSLAKDLGRGLVDPGSEYWASIVYGIKPTKLGRTGFAVRARDGKQSTYLIVPKNSAKEEVEKVMVNVHNGVDFDSPLRGISGSYLDAAWENLFQNRLPDANGITRQRINIAGRDWIVSKVYGDNNLYVQEFGDETGKKYGPYASISDIREKLERAQRELEGTAGR